MNTAILHSARPDKSQNKKKLPKAALKFAAQMGLDLKGLQSEVTANNEYLSVSMYSSHFILCRRKIYGRW